MQDYELSQIIEAVGWVPTKTALQILGVSKPTLKTLSDKGHIKRNRISQKYIYYDLASIKAYMSGASSG